MSYARWPRDLARSKRLTDVDASECPVRQAETRGEGAPQYRKDVSTHAPLLFARAAQALSEPTGPNRVGAALRDSAAERSPVARSRRLGNDLDASGRTRYLVVAGFRDPDRVGADRYRAYGRWCPARDLVAWRRRHAVWVVRDIGDARRQGVGGADDRLGLGANRRRRRHCHQRR